MPSRRQFIQRGARLLGLAAALPLLPRALLAEAPGALLQRPIPASGELLPVIGLGTSRTFHVGLDDASLAPLSGSWPSSSPAAAG